ncbi:S1 family peptidase [Flavisolibacter nicotianae]|uniref:S1 family peptidase n=1 Tax=Flavisolibacter nicotianae TaxID=2364882 RepID=UPI000EADA696|nr:serine protease [Flavisolibacter nicotianae]
MEDVKLVEAVERYLSGEMPAEEQAYFESLRKSNPEVDQLVVEHSFFLQQLNRFEDLRQLKSKLNETHLHLVEDGTIHAPKLKGGAKLVYLFHRYKRTAAIAASIAGITAMAISALVWSFSPVKNGMTQDVQQLNRKIDNLEQHNRVQDNKINTVIRQMESVPPTPPANITYTSGGTGFLVNAKGYLVTNYHVVEGAKYIAVQNSAGKDLQALVVYPDPKRDIAILKIVDTAFKAPSSIPYSIRKTTADIAEPIFSLGYPRNDIVYGEGYLAARTGYNGDTLSMQISIDANRGNSGSPIINRNGEIIGVLSARQTSAEGAVFAVQSKYIYKALSELRKADSAYQNVKLPATSSLKGADRTQQVKKISDFVYMVKVNYQQ